MKVYGNVTISVPHCCPFCQSRDFSTASGEVLAYNAEERRLNPTLDCEEWALDENQCHDCGKVWWT